MDPSFKRTEIGTDVFVVGFMNKKDWQTEIITSVLEDFLVAIYKGYLEVCVGNVNISKDTLSDVIEEYKDSAKMAYNYYLTMTSEDTHYLLTNYDDLGEIELYILIQNGLHRRVLMSRSNGMKVFDQKNFPSAIQFAGICILKNENINSYFREMENPAHDAWEPERHSTPSQAKKKRQGLFKFIKEYVLEYGRKTTVAEMDAEGVGEFLPDEIPGNTDNGKQEDVTDNTKSMDLSISLPKNNTKGYEATGMPGGDKSELGLGLPEDVETGETGGKDQGDDDPNNSSGGSGFGGNDGDGHGSNGDGNTTFPSGKDDSDSTQQVKRKFAIRVMRVRLMQVGNKSNRYRLIFTPEKTAGDGFLKLKLSGEQSEFEMNVSDACYTGKKDHLKTDKNVIYLNDIVANSKISLEFNVDFSEKSSMEVGLYGYKI